MLDRIKIRGLRWAIEIFGSAQSALTWAFGYFDRNLYPDSATFRDLHIPDAEPREHIPKRSEFNDFCATDYHVEANRILSDAENIVPGDWPVIEMAFSQCDKTRARAIESVRDILLCEYPPEYIQLVCAMWRNTTKISPCTLHHLSGVSERKEKRWRGDITELLNDQLDRIISKIENA